MKIKKKSVLTLQDFTRDEIEELLEYAINIKNNKKENLAGKTIVTLLLTPDIHIRLGMGVVSSQLKMENVVIDCTREKWDLKWESGEMTIGESSEHSKDIAKILERYGDCIAVRHIPNSGKWQIEIGRAHV